MKATGGAKVIALLGLFAIATGFGCTTKKSVVSGTSATPIVDYCPYLPSRTFSSSVTITGSANYQYRTNGNGAVNGTPNPIRYAEVMVKDASGITVQCAETDSSGNFSFQLPSNSGDFTVYVNSRANNDNLKAYIMNNPSDNTYHSISTTVSSNSNSSISLTASATGTLEGGAFNILDKIASANDYMRTKITSATCSVYNISNPSECTAFTVAPLAYVYWTKGFNPAAYTGGDTSTGTSFFLRGTNELYILGGIDGDVDSSDTDHFDNTIIVHEYGHFIENQLSTTSTTGGAHGPNDVLDPRLAWSEAWANFFQAAVLSNPVYRDTEGNVDCGTPSSSCTGAYINESLEAGTLDAPASMLAGEGIFREFAITRLLWDALDPVSGATDTDNDGVSVPFAEISTILFGTGRGFAASDRYFRNAGLFYELHESMPGRTQSWSTIISDGKQRADRKDFANPLTLGGSCASGSISAYMQTNGSYEESDLFYDNDFYAYSHSGGALNVKVTYSGSSDIDLIVWKDGYIYGRTSAILAKSRSASDGSDEEITVSAPAGMYMIDIMVNPVAGVTTASTYEMYINGQRACPTY